jgi:hypothetical protein
MAGTRTTSIRSYNYFLDVTVTNAAYVLANPNEFVDPDGTPFLSASLLFTSDGGGDIYFSFDGVNDHGRVKINETLQMDYRRQRRVWLRKATADVPCRFWAW